MLFPTKEERAIYRKDFATLWKNQTFEDGAGLYFITIDGVFSADFIANNDNEAITKFLERR